MDHPTGWCEPAPPLPVFPQYRGKYYAVMTNFVIGVFLDTDREDWWPEDVRGYPSEKAAWAAIRAAESKFYATPVGVLGLAAAFAISPGFRGYDTAEEAHAAYLLLK